MNRFDKLLGKKREAKIRFLHQEFEMLAPGDYVLCAVTKEPINLQDLKYWNVDRQEAYASAAIALKAELAYLKE